MKSKPVRSARIPFRAGLLTGLLAAAVSLPFMASNAAHAQQPPQAQKNLTPEQKAKIEEMRKRRQQRNPDAGGGQKTRNGDRQRPEGGPPPGLAKKPQPNPAVQTQQPKQT